MSCSKSEASYVLRAVPIARHDAQKEPLYFDDYSITAYLKDATKYSSLEEAVNVAKALLSGTHYYFPVLESEVVLPKTEKVEYILQEYDARTMSPTLQKLGYHKYYTYLDKDYTSCTSWLPFAKIFDSKEAAEDASKAYGTRGHCILVPKLKSEAKYKEEKEGVESTMNEAYVIQYFDKEGKPIERGEYCLPVYFVKNGVAVLTGTDLSRAKQFDSIEEAAKFAISLTDKDVNTYCIPVLYKVAERNSSYKKDTIYTLYNQKLSGTLHSIDFAYLTDALTKASHLPGTSKICKVYRLWKTEDASSIEIVENKVILEVVNHQEVKND